MSLLWVVIREWQECFCSEEWRRQWVRLWSNEGAQQDGAMSQKYKTQNQEDKLGAKEEVKQKVREKPQKIEKELWECVGQGINGEGGGWRMVGLGLKKGLK